MKKTRKNFYFDKFAYFLVAVFVLVFFLLSLGRHMSLKSYFNDIGVYDQIVWNNLHGRFFEETSGMLGENNYLGAHFSPILIVLAPFYFFWSNPKFLLLLQSLAVGISAIPIYLFAKEKLNSGIAGIVFLLSYFSCPFLHNGIIYDFHEVVFAVPFAAFSFYFLEKRKDSLFFIFATLLSLSQEHLSLLVFMMGLYAFFVQKRRRFGILVSVFSLAYFSLVIAILMPLFSSTGKVALIEGNLAYPSRYAWLGSSFSEIFKNILTNPVQIFLKMISAERIKFLFLLLIPVFSLGLYSWIFLITFPILAINLLSDNSMTFSPYFYHNAIIVPFIFFSAIVVFRKWFLEDYFLKKSFLILILATSFWAAFLYGVTPISQNYHLIDYFPDRHARKISEIKDIVPKDASLSVQHNLGPHFSQRRFIYRFPLKIDSVEYVIIDQTDPYRYNQKQIFKFDYALQMDMVDWKNKIEELRNSDRFDLIYEEDGYLVFKSKFPVSISE